MHEVSFVAGDQKRVKKLLWVTDPHFNLVEKKKYHSFLKMIKASDAEGILLGGDISDGSSSFVYLKDLHQKTGKEIYFILGNHDFFFHSIYEIRATAENAALKYPHIHYLTRSDPIALNEETVLIGHDGWADGRAGDFYASDIVLQDYFNIKDLKDTNKEQLLVKLNTLGTEAAKDVEVALEKVKSQQVNIIFLTHAPPFIEACKHFDHDCDDNWGPHFVSVAVGHALEKYALQHPEKQILVLCGHAHSHADVNILPNLRALTGSVNLGFPSEQGIITYNF